MSFQELVKKEFASLAPNFFNSAYFGPMPMRAQVAAKSAIEVAANPVNFSHDQWRPIPDALRVKLAGLLGVSGDNISHHGGASEVVSAISLGFPFKSGDTVVLMEGDYPSDVIPWMVNEARMGYKIVKLPEECFRDPALLIKKIPASAKVLNISHVMFNTGRKNNLVEIGRICRERNILFVVDATQSLGGMPLSSAEVSACDVILVSTYKWILGPHGHAFAYWNQRALAEVANTHLSWQTTRNSAQAGQLLNYTTEPLPGARRFDRAQAPNFIAMKALAASVDVITEAGLEIIEIHNRSLVSQFLETYPKKLFSAVTPIGEHANILCLRQQGQRPSSELEAALRQKKIEASVREGNLRLAFHVFNTSKEVDFLVRTLADI